MYRSLNHGTDKAGKTDATRQPSNRYPLSFVRLFVTVFALTLNPNPSALDLILNPKPLNHLTLNP